MVPDSDASRIARLEQAVPRLEQQVKDLDYNVKVMAPVSAQVGVQNIRIDNLDRDVRDNHAELVQALTEMKSQSVKDREAWQRKLEDKEAQQSKERKDLRNAAIGLAGVICTTIGGVIIAILTHGVG
jgi:hypothetical protein